MNLLQKSPALNILDEIFGLDQIDWDHGQIAIRRAHNCPKPLPPEAHIDGFASGLNGLDEGKIYNHTILVGVFLTPVRKAFAGNFTIWPTSHYVYERYFRERGARAIKEPMPTLDLGQPVQLTCEVRDVVLAHYQLGHAAAVNTSDQDRIAVYFRVWLRLVELDRWHYLTNIWKAGGSNTRRKTSRTVGRSRGSRQGHGARRQGQEPAASSTKTGLNIQPAPANSSCKLLLQSARAPGLAGADFFHHVHG